jgi:hypothetical protein
MNAQSLYWASGQFAFRRAGAIHSSTDRWEKFGGSRTGFKKICEGFPTGRKLLAAWPLMHAEAILCP